MTAGPHDAPTPPEPVAVLAYATPGDRPEQGQFTVEDHPDGVTLFRPLPATPAEAMGLLLTTFLFGAFALGLAASGFHSASFDLPHAVAFFAGAVIPAAVAVFSLSHLPTTRARLMALVLRGGRLTVLNSPYRPWGVRCAIGSPTAFHTRPELPGVSLRPVVGLHVMTSTGRTRRLLSTLPRPEGEWAAGRLNAALSERRD